MEEPKIVTGLRWVERPIPLGDGVSQMDYALQQRLATLEVKPYGPVLFDEGWSDVPKTSE